MMVFSMEPVGTREFAIKKLLRIKAMTAATTII